MKIWVEIDEARLVENFRVLAGALAEGVETSALLAVVKANAYGHGLAACVPALVRAGAEWLGVSDTEEGARIRELLGPAAQPQVLVMSGMTGAPGEAESIVRHRLTPVVWESWHLDALVEALAGAARRRSERVAVHVEVDTGMARQGVAPGALLGALLQQISKEPALELGGVLTHFASAEVTHSAQTAVQQEQFAAAMAQVEAAGLRPQWVHVGNSSYIDNGSEADSLAWARMLAVRVGARPMVRAGVGLYGYRLPLASESGPEAGSQPAGTVGLERVGAQLRPVMAWKTRVIGLREVESGATVGYNGIFVAQQASRLALLPVGYADGLRRELSGSNLRAGGWVVIRGRRAPIVGRVSMNLTTVDVSGIEAVAVGDEVLLLGDGVTADDHARLAGTIAYEILCGVKTSA